MLLVLNLTISEVIKLSSHAESVMSARMNTGNSLELLTPEYTLYRVQVNLTEPFEDEAAAVLRAFKRSPHLVVHKATEVKIVFPLKKEIRAFARQQYVMEGPKAMDDMGYICVELIGLSRLDFVGREADAVF